MKRSAKKKEEFGTIHFKTKEAQVIFNQVIVGQLSNGKWELDEPEWHWVFWTNAHQVVDGTEKTVGEPVKNDYDIMSLLRDKSLYECMEDILKSMKTKYAALCDKETLKFVTEACYKDFYDMTPFYHKKKMEETGMPMSKFSKAYLDDLASVGIDTFEKMCEAQGVVKSQSIPKDAVKETLKSVYASMSNVCKE